MTRKILRRLALLYLVLLAVAVVQGLVAAVANASTGSPTAVSLLSLIPLPALATILSGNLIPYLSALATRKAGWWTGAVTVALSLLGALLAALTQSGGQNVYYVLAVAALTWLMARLHLRTFIKATDVEVWLHSHGITATARPAAPTPATAPTTTPAGS